MIQLDASNFQALLDSNDNFLFDCDGVLWHGNTLLPGAADSLAKLKEKKKKIFCVTNNSTSTRAQYAVKCQKLGLPVVEADIVCTAHSTALYLKDLLKIPENVAPGAGPKVYVVGSPALEAELTAVGIFCFGVGPDPVPDDFSQDTTAIPLEKDVKAVVVGFDKNISFLKMIKAASYLKNPSVFFVATNTDQSFPSSSSAITVPGTGCIVVSVEMAAGRKAKIIGKPETLMIDFLKKEFNLDTSRSVFVGDRLDTDIWLAAKCQMKSLFVLTGVSTLQEAKKHSEKDNKAANKELVPNFYLNGMNVFKTLIFSSSGDSNVEKS